ncbi:MAG: hypothetical protein PHT33_06075 [bacterium]|nr:hypothetical protein [bacterium]
MKQGSYDWVKEANMTSWWLSWNDLRWPSPDVISGWERRADEFSRLGVNAVTTFGFHFRWDFLNHWELYNGILSNIVEICHDRGIKVVDHHSNVYSHRARNSTDRRNIAVSQAHHLPFYPDSWENMQVNGKRMSDWRIISARTGAAAYSEGYNAEMFCPNNPDFREEYQAYVSKLINNTGIDGLMSDDTAFPEIYSCVCRHCTEKYRQRTGQDIPASESRDFWGNYDSALFQEWVAMRYESTTEFYAGVKSAMPENVALWGCSCGDIMPYKVKQAHSYEMWIEHMDAVFIEIYHKLDLERDRNRIFAELTAASSLANYVKKPLLVICYSDRKEDFDKWGSILEDFNARPWFCRQVRANQPVPEEEILQGGFPYVESRVAPKADCGVVYSKRLKDYFGHENPEYYNN